MLQKRGQVTIFIIIGIILLIGAIFAVYITVIKPKTAEPVEKTTKMEFEGQAELHNYVMSCLRPAVIEGIEIMRLQGGYIDVPEDVETIIVKDRTNRIVKVDDTGSLRVIMDNESEGNSVPLWIGSDYINIPSDSFLENQLKMYIEYETLKCIDFFKPFNGQGYEITTDDITVSPHIENSVIVDMDFPIHVKKGDVEYTLSEFSYSVPVDWKRILDAASTISTYELGSNYLEYFTNQMISLYSGPSENRLPPMAATIGSLSCDSVSWEIDDVNAKVMAIMYKNMPDIRIAKTNYSELSSDNPATQNFYDSLVYDVFQEEDMRLNITHKYKPEWGMNFDILPKAGGILRPDITHGKGIPMLNQFCSIKYNFKYYVQYPSLITINHFDSAAIDPFTNSYQEGQGYEFSFPIKVVIYGNQKRELVPKSDTIAYSEQIAEETSIQMDVPMSQLFCEPEQRLSHNILLTAVDIFTNETIPRADIYFNSPHTIGTCFIDSTKDDGVSNAKYPLCHNCYVNLIKEDYVDENKIISTDKPGDRYRLYMEPYKEFDLKVMQIYLPKFMEYYYETDGFTKQRICTEPENYTIDNLSSAPLLNNSISGMNNPLFLSTLSDIEANEKAILTIESTDPDRFYSENIIYPLVDKIKLSSGYYKVNAILNGYSVINPSTYEKHDKKVTISLHETGVGTYNGYFDVGNTEYDFDLGYVYFNDSITLLTLANYLPSIPTDVDHATVNAIIKDDGSLEYSYSLDHDCNESTYPRQVKVSLNKGEYKKFLMPIIE